MVYTGIVHIIKIAIRQGLSTYQKIRLTFPTILESDFCNFLRMNGEIKKKFANPLLRPSLGYARQFLLESVKSKN